MTDLIERLYSMQGMGDVQLRALMDGVGPKGADEIKHLRAELMEQCRLLGMSAEREAKHLAQIAELEKERDALRAELDALRKEADKFSDGVDWIQRAMQAEAELDALKGQEPVAWECRGDIYSVPQRYIDTNRLIPGQVPLYARPILAQSVPDVTETMKQAFYSVVEITKEGTVLRLAEGIKAALTAALKPEVK